jgi:guanylate kinase
MIKIFYSLFLALISSIANIFKPKKNSTGANAKEGGIVVLSIDDQGFRMVRHLVHNGVVLVLVPAAMLDEEFLKKLMEHFSSLL